MAQDADDATREAPIFGHHLVERPLVESEQHRILDRRDRCGALLGIERRQLAEDLAASQHAQLLLAVVDANLSVDHDVHRAAEISFLDDALTGSRLDLLQHGSELEQILFGGFREDLHRLEQQHSFDRETHTLAAFLPGLES